MIVIDVNTIVYLWLPGDQTELAERALARDPGRLADLLTACVAESRRVLAASGVYGRHASLGRLWGPSGWLMMRAECAVM